jgi:hypothetical protein
MDEAARHQHDGAARDHEEHLGPAGGREDVLDRLVAADQDAQLLADRGRDRHLPIVARRARG